MRTPDIQDLTAAHQLVENMLDQCRRDTAVDSYAVWRHRMAARKSLESSRMLMGVVQRLMLPADPSKPAEAEARLKTCLEELKTAARGAYQAGLLLTGAD